MRRSVCGSSFSSIQYISCPVGHPRTIEIDFTEFSYSIVGDYLDHLGFVRLNTTYISNSHVSPISGFQLPKTHVTSSRCHIIMLVGICWLEPYRAEVAEVSVTREANHMVAAMGLLGRSSAGRARCSVMFEVLHRSLILFSKLAGLGHRDAESEFAVPALVTSTAEGKRTVLAHREKIVSSKKPLSAVITIRIPLVIRFHYLESLGLPMLLRASRTLAPFSWAVNGIFVRLQVRLVLQLNVSCDHLMIQGNLKQLARTELYLCVAALLRRS
jgi:hypothetical protein